MDPNTADSLPAPATTSGGAAIAPPPRGYALSGKIMLSAIVVLFTVVLLLLFIHLYVRWHVYRRDSRRSRRRRRSHLLFAGTDRPPAPRGLDPKVLSSLTVQIYSDSESADCAAECAVCLSEFADGEKVRSLPRCDHRFHIECIDMWFFSHNTCPLCRSDVEADSPPPVTADPAVESGLPLQPQPSPPLPPREADFCSNCRIGEGNSSIGSPSADSELSIDVRELELGFGSTSRQAAKSPGNRILLLRRFLSSYRPGVAGGEPDLERGEAPPSPPPPPPPPPPSTAL